MASSSSSESSSSGEEEVEEVEKAGEKLEDEVPEAVEITNELPDFPEDLDEDLEKQPSKTQIMQARKAQKEATRDLTRSFTTGLMPISLSARSSSEDPAEAEEEGPLGMDSARQVDSPRSPQEEQGPRRCCAPLGAVRARGAALRSGAAERCERRCGCCLRAARCCGDLWEAFEGRCQALATAIRCFCCPLILLLRILSCGLCGCRARRVKRSGSLRRTRTRKTVNRSTSVVGRSTSAGAGRLTRSSTSAGRLTRSSTWGSSKYSEGPREQPRSRLKEIKPRVKVTPPVGAAGAGGSAGKATAQRSGKEVSKATSAREEFRQVRKTTLQKLPEIIEDEDEELEILEGWEALIWTDFLPWNWSQTYQVWKESRVEMWQHLGPVLVKMEEGDDPDGLCPTWVMRKWRIFVLAYWDPFLDHLPGPGRVLTWLLWSSLIVPVVLFGVSSVLLTVSVLRNLEYVEGRCQIEQLPESFETQRGAVTQVRGTYLIRRFYRASPERLAGHVVQSCQIQVPCDHVDLSRTGRMEDDRCDSFKIWAWKDPITCFYHQSDEYGTLQRELLCLARPSDLQEEVFGVILSAGAVLMSLLIVALVKLRRRLERREAQKHLQEFAEQEEKERQEADAIALKQFEEFKKQEGVEEDDEESDLGDLVWADRSARTTSWRTMRMTRNESTAAA